MPSERDTVLTTAKVHKTSNQHNQTTAQSLWTARGDDRTTAHSL